MENVCKYCFELFESATKADYCNESCASGRRRDASNEKRKVFGSAHPSWKGGVSVYPNQSVLRKNVALLKRIHKTCEQCGQSVFKLHAHHKDLSKDNHALNNLKILCQSCHAKLHSELKKQSTVTLNVKETIT